MTSQTLFMLMAQYNGSPLIPVEVVCRDYFAPLTLPVFLRKLAEGNIALPVVRMENSQKGAKMIHLGDLASYIDARRKEGQDEVRKLH
jgi:hypothetical protein